MANGGAAILVMGVAGLAAYFYSRQGAQSTPSVQFLRRSSSDNKGELFSALFDTAFDIFEGVGDSRGGLPGIFGGGGGEGIFSDDGLPATVAALRPQPTGGQISGLLRLIGSVEAPRGYDQVYGGSVLQPPKPITTMTVAQVLDYQDANVRAGSASSAVGRYQFIRGTLRSLVSGGHARMSDRFTPSMQDSLATELARRRGLDQYRSGQISETTFANNLAKEWASLPVTTGSNKGRSHYAGDGLNKSLVSVTQVLSEIRRL